MLWKIKFCLTLSYKEKLRHLNIKSKVIEFKTQRNNSVFIQLSRNIILQSLNKHRGNLPFKTIYNKLKIPFTQYIQ